MDNQDPPTQEEVIVKSEAVVEEPIERPKDPEPVSEDITSILMKRLDAMEETNKRLMEASIPKPKVKRKPTEKQLEALKVAREKKMANVSKRREIKKNIKLEQQQYIKEELKRESKKPEPEPEPQKEISTNNNVIEESSTNVSNDQKTETFISVNNVNAPLTQPHTTNYDTYENSVYKPNRPKQPANPKPRVSGISSLFGGRSV